MAVTHFVTLFTHVFIHPRDENRKKNYLLTTVLKMWSQICWKKSICVHKTTFKQNLQKLKTTKNHKSIHNLWKLKQTKIILFMNFWDHIFETIFLIDFFLFSTLKRLETCVNCVTNCVTAKIYPLKIKFQ